MNPLDYSIIILNYNGEAILERSIQHSLEAMKQSNFTGELIVADNASSDSSHEIISKFEGEMRSLNLQENRVLQGYNDAAKIADGKILILLNNDEFIDPNFLDNILEPFSKISDLFLVCNQCLNEGTRTYQSGLIEAEFKKGHIWLRHEFQPEDTQKSKLVSLGCLGAYQRKMFLEIGGFEALFLPFYWEDADLSYRASKRGWKCYYQPSARAEHIHRGTISSFDPNFVRFVNRRNKILFFWLNIEDPLLWLLHFAIFPIFVLRSLILDGTLDYLRACFWILTHLRPIFKEKRKRQAFKKVKDSALLC
jgi:O-antigen biosynthesis protein